MSLTLYSRRVLDPVYATAVRLTIRITSLYISYAVSLICIYTGSQRVAVHR